MLRIFSFAKSGADGVRGGLLAISRIIFFCVLISDCMYVFLRSSVPQIGRVPIRWG